MALHLASRLYTLLVEDQGARLWDEEGNFLAFLPDLSFGASLKIIWGEALKDYLPKNSKVQVIVAKSNLEIRCQPTPNLKSRERRDVQRRFLQRRFLQVDESSEPVNAAHAFDTDPHAEGGHQLWVAWHPDKEIKDWVAALSYAGASITFATVWQRAFLAAVEGQGPVNFLLGVDKELARLVLFHGREMVLQRVFRIPEGLDPMAPEEESQEQLSEILSEEISRTVQFVKQKFRSIAIGELQVVGLGELSKPFVERMARTRVTVKLLPESLSRFLIRGARKEQDRPAPLDLVPPEIQDAIRFRLMRVGVWMAAAIIVMGLAMAQFMLERSRSQLKESLKTAEMLRDIRKRDLEEAEKVARFRFGLLRLRMAETHQKKAVEKLESLGVQLFQAPKGLSLELVDIVQLKGEGLRYRFEIHGSASSHGRLSTGPLADYMQRLALQGIRLDPLKDVSVSDRALRLDQGGSGGERAVTRFRLTGVML